MTLRIACLCGDAAQEVLLEPSADHSTLHLCHCTACRAVTGLLCSAYYRLQSQPQKLDHLREYSQFECTTRYFCRTCGAHAFARLNHTGQYFVAAGLLVENPPPIKSVRHWRQEDTRDDGLTSFLPSESGDTTAACWLQEIPDNQQLCSQETAPEDSHRISDRELSAQCHCGGIQFYITVPDSSSTAPSSPWPDLLVAYHSNPPENTADVKWWLRDNNSKYLAGTCSCRSCRLGSGFPIQAWAFVPKSNIFNANSSPMAFDAGTIQQYQSSPGVYREFCNRCGATVFWHCDERPLLIDVSVGLLRAKSGTRAEDWLDWHTGRVSFAEMALDQKFIQQLEAGLKHWGEARKIGEYRID